jgi:alginate O-acetyltransferase complex protein AlgJ
MNAPETYPSREDQARAEIGETDVSPMLSRVISALFVVMICGVPIIQLLHSRSQGEDVAESSRSATAALVSEMKSAVSMQSGLMQSVLAANGVLKKHITLYESQLDESLFLSKALLSPVQMQLCRMGVGNEKAFVGRDGWLFYEPGVVSLTGPGFLDSRQIEARRRTGPAGLQPDPVPAIIHMRDQLKEQGVELVVMPVPVKPSIHPEKFSRRALADSPLHNASWDKLLMILEEQGVHVFDPSEALSRSAEANPQYLRTDTHWCPEAMQHAAADLAQFLVEKKVISIPTELAYSRTAMSITNLGDIGVMLKLPESQDLFHEETVTIQQVRRRDGKGLHEEEPSAVLLLGDSFSNIYSLEGMGWGSQAGLAEQLRVEINQPVESIVRNDAGALATRQMLIQSLKRGEPRLAGKKVVVWEFAARECALGDWQVLDLPTVDVQVSDESPGADASIVEVSGRVLDVSGRPEKGAVYKNFIMKLHMGEMKRSDGSTYDDGEGVVHVMAMKNREILPIANIHKGDQLTLFIQPWDKVRAQFESMKSGLLPDEEVELLSTLYWGEPISR